MRTDLREFQQQILTRLSDASMTAQAAGYLGFIAGGQCWLVEVPTLKEVIPPPPIAPVNLTRPWFVGVANVRGELYCITDMNGFLTGTPTSRDINNRILLLQETVMQGIGLLVQRVMGLHDLSRYRQVTTDDGTDGYEDENGTIWHPFDARRFVSGQAFMEIAA